MPNVFTDTRLRSQVTDGRLHENTDYYVDVEGYSEDDVSRFFTLSGMRGMYEWIPGNPVAKFRFTNHIGKCRIGSQQFDIQSDKFLEELTGEQQIARLLDEIKRWNATFPLDIDSPVHVARMVDWSNPSTELLHEFNYFYHAFFSVDRDNRIPWLFQRVLSNPHLMHSVKRERDFVWKVMRVDSDVAKNLVSGLGESVNVINSRELIDSPILGEYPLGTIKSIPLRISHTSYLLDTDTPENRFIKFLFEYIVVICARAEHVYSDAPLILQRIRRLESHVRQILSNEFFIHVGRIVQIPVNSTILRYRHGYRELHEHYIKARMGIVPKFYNAIEGQVSEVKNVAILYEIWCFYLVASRVLGDECIYRKSKVRFEETNIVYGDELSNEKFSVSYNRTFRSTDSGSYSLAFRPDITVVDLDSSDVFVFDAKYRALLEFDTDDNIVSRKYQSNDVHKMHTYLDVITKCQASFVLYVGDQFHFFPRDEFSGGIRHVRDLTTLNGVGVIPLVPGNERWEFEHLIDKLTHTR